MSKQKFVSDITKPIIPQLQAFAPDMRISITALNYLTSAEDIKKFFAEKTEIHRLESPDHPDPRESVRAELAYICNYDESWTPAWRRFEKVLRDQFEDAQRNCINSRNTKN